MPQPLLAASQGPAIVVVGVGRSGTSLVQSMLAAHPAIVFPPETGFIRRYVSSMRLSRIAARGGVDMVRRALEADATFLRLPFSVEEWVTACAEKRSPLSDVTLYQQLCNHLARQTGAQFVGDKDPRLVEFLPIVAAYWPKTHIVHVVRDPRDVLLSKTKAAWASHQPVVRHIFANRVQFKIGRADGPRLFGERYHEVVYESLLGDPTTTLTELCTRLGLPFSPKMLEYNTAARTLVSAEELPWKKETLGPLLQANSGKWKTRLPRWQSRLTEITCADAMGIGGYTAQPLSQVGWQARLKARGLQVILIAADPLYRLYRRLSMKTRSVEGTG